MVKIKEIVWLTDINEGGEWNSNIRLLEYLKGRGYQINIVGFKHKITPYPAKIFSQEYYVKYCEERKRRFSFVFSLINNFINARNEINKLLGDNKRVDLLYATDYLMVLAATTIKKARDVGIIFSYQGTRLGSDNWSYRQTILALLEKLSLLRAKVIIVPSKDNVSLVKSKLGFIGKRKKVAIVPNSVTNVFFEKPTKNNLFRLLGKYKIGDSNFVIVYSGRISKHKGLKLLAIAFKKLLNKAPSSLLIIAYPTSNQDLMLVKELREILKGEIERKRVVLVKDSSLEDLITIYNIADVMVLASSLEFAPLSVLEAMAAGIPCVISAVGNTTSLISKVDSRLVMQNVSVSELEKKLKFVMKLSKIEKANIARKAKTVARKYSPVNSANKFIQMLSLLNK